MRMLHRRLAYGIVAVFTGLALTLASIWVASRHFVLSECDLRARGTVETNGVHWSVSRHAMFGASRVSALGSNVRGSINDTFGPSSTKQIRSLLSTEVSNAGSLQPGSILKVVVDARGFPLPAVQGQYTVLIDPGGADRVWTHACALFPLPYDPPLLAVETQYIVYGSDLIWWALLLDIGVWALISAGLFLLVNRMRGLVGNVTVAKLVIVSGMAVVLGIVSAFVVAIVCYGITYVGTFPDSDGDRWGLTTDPARNLTWRVIRDKNSGGVRYVSSWHEMAQTDSFMTYPPDAESEDLVPQWNELVPRGTEGMTVVFAWGWPKPFLLSVTQGTHSASEWDCLGRWVFPCSIVWWPMISNIAIYSAWWLAAIAILFGSDWLKRARRRALRLCLQCGYRTNKCSICPECGHAADGGD